MRRALRVYPVMLMMVGCLASCVGALQAGGAGGDSPTTEEESEGDAHVSSAVTWLGSDVVFATGQECESLLGVSDGFSREHSALDRGVRMKTVEATDEAAYLAFASATCLDWEAAERATWTESAMELGVALQGLNLSLPPKIYLIKTNGTDEFGSAYTRGSNKIVLPSDYLQDGPPMGDTKARVTLLAHELWHLVTRRTPSIRDAYYAVLGFHPVEGVVYPATLEATRLTNPDAFTLGHAIEVESDDGPFHAVPILQMKVGLRELVEMNLKAGEFFGQLVVMLLDVDPGTGALRGSPVSANATNYPALVGLNTRYIIHPEEAVADNFAALVTQRHLAFVVTVPHQEILDALEALLTRQ